MRARDFLSESISVGKHQLSQASSAGQASFALQARELAAITREYVEKHCQPWLRQSGAGLAFRGVSGGVHRERVLFTHPIRHNRKPKDSSRQEHDLFNGIILQAGGAANRSNSAFVTPRLSVAETYGQPFIVMPVGEFHYTWSPTVSDWYSRSGEVRSWWDVDAVLDEVPHQSLERFLEVTGTDNLRKGLEDMKSGHWPKAAQFARQLGLPFEVYTPESVAPHVWADRGLEQALSKGHEIMIHADEMLYLSASEHGAMTNYRVSPF